MLELKDFLPQDGSKDFVNQPPHYKQGKIETIDIIMDITKKLPGDQGYLVGNIIKYVSRYTFKNGAEDLKKAGWYLDKLIETTQEGKSDE